VPESLSGAEVYFRWVVVTVITAIICAHLICYRFIWVVVVVPFVEQERGLLRRCALLVAPVCP
jgi:hypothetical protein